jgi:choline-sulfatase
VAQPVALLDLAPTLLDLAGFEPPGMPRMDARSFAPLVRGAADDAEAGEAYAVMVRDRSVPRDGQALVAGRYKVIEVDGRKPELYDLAADPAEAKNLAKKRKKLLRDMTERLRRRRSIDAIAPF